MSNPEMPETRSHILAINNDQAVLGLFVDLLTDEGYRTSTMTYHEKDMDTVIDLKPDLIILDYMWASDDSGWSFLQMLQMHPATSAIPIVICTAAVREVEPLIGHLETMAVAVIIKPFNIGHLLAIVADMLGNRSPQTSSGTNGAD